MNRRQWFQFGAVALSGLAGLALALPGAAYVLSPILNRRERASDFRTLTRLGELRVSEPTAFPIIEERRDAWVTYPAEPVGSVWLVRRPEGVDPPVLAFSAECPHLGCAVNLSADGRSFLCPCHTSAFTIDGERLNDIPPRGMDRLEVEPIVDPGNPSAPVRVKFERFRTMTKEKTPLA